MSGISTHVLDTSIGRPASGVRVVLEVHSAGKDWKVVGKGKTDADGRVANLLPAGSHLEPANYRLTFDVSSYFRAQKVASFYSEVSTLFAVRDAAQHYHIPLLLSPYGYTTYRGS
ncbi:MAG: hydroxyisourate hydrolase [Acidobacteria bacterium]|nr:MAG: hydroxyisourate hydrolase [Acidobacteriota bacterium]